MLRMCVRAGASTTLRHVLSRQSVQLATNAFPRGQTDQAGQPASQPRSPLRESARFLPASFSFSWSFSRRFSSRPFVSPSASATASSFSLFSWAFFSRTFSSRSSLYAFLASPREDYLVPATDISIPSVVESVSRYDARNEVTKIYFRESFKTSRFSYIPKPMRPHCVKYERIQVKPIFWVEQYFFLFLTIVYEI